MISALKEQVSTKHQPLATIESHDDFELQTLPSEKSLGKLVVELLGSELSLPETKKDSAFVDEKKFIIISEEQKEFIQEPRNDDICQLQNQKSWIDVSLEDKALTQAQAQQEE